MITQLTELHFSSFVQCEVQNEASDLPNVEACPAGLLAFAALLSFGTVEFIAPIRALFYRVTSVHRNQNGGKAKMATWVHSCRDIGMLSSQVSQNNRIRFRFVRVNTRRHWGVCFVSGALTFCISLVHVVRIPHEVVETEAPEWRDDNGTVGAREAAARTRVAAVPLVRPVFTVTKPAVAFTKYIKMSH